MNNKNKKVANAWMFAGLFLILLGAFWLITRPTGSILWIIGMINVFILGQGCIYLAKRIKRHEPKT